MANLIKFELLFLLIFLMVGCASKRPNQIFYSRIYDEDFESVWDCTLKALTDYPIKLALKDSGRIESELINGPYNELLFTYPDKIEIPERFRFSLSLTFAKLLSSDNKPLTRIRLRKKLERFEDFYTGWINYPSDGLEEKTLLYRIEHLINMEKHLKKVTQ